MGCPWIDCFCVMDVLFDVYCSTSTGTADVRACIVLLHRRDDLLNSRAARTAMQVDITQ